MEKSSREQAIETYVTVRELYEGSETARGIVNEAEMCLFAGRDDDAVKCLKALPTEKQLFDGIVSKLGRDNAVSKTLKRVAKGKDKRSAEMCKALFSIGTHAMIQVEKGDDRYVALAKRIAETLADRLRKGVVVDHGDGK